MAILWVRVDCLCNCTQCQHLVSVASKPLLAVVGRVHVLIQSYRQAREEVHWPASPLGLGWAGYRLWAVQKCIFGFRAGIPPARPMWPKSALSFVGPAPPPPPCSQGPGGALVWVWDKVLVTSNEPQAGCCRGEFAVFTGTLSQPSWHTPLYSTLIQCWGHG